VIPLRHAGRVVLDDARTPVALRLGGAGILPVTFGLDQNFPNPFNPSTEIGFRVPVRSAVTLRMYDLLGREITTLFSGVVEPGTRRVQWDGNDRNGVPVAGGVYFCRMEGTDPATHGRVYTGTRKMLLLK
jgi:hypothetical protein